MGIFSSTEQQLPERPSVLPGRFDSGKLKTRLSRYLYMDHHQNLGRCAPAAASSCHGFQGRVLRLPITLPRHATRKQGTSGWMACPATTGCTILGHRNTGMQGPSRTAQLPVTISEGHLAVRGTEANCTVHGDVVKHTTAIVGPCRQQNADPAPATTLQG